MTTLYKPVLIESAEQAEALPEGTIVRSKVGTFLEKGRFDRWWHGSYQRRHPGVVGWSALVPIEAEEEVLIEDTFASSEQIRRYTTPWQRFTGPKETR